MSRVHLKLIKVSADESHVGYDVMSPDFSESGVDEELIGVLALELKEGKYIYEPVAKLRNVFCPPEWFEEYGGDFKQVNAKCAASGYRCTAWANLIYRKAKQMLESGEFKETSHASA